MSLHCRPHDLLKNRVWWGQVVHLKAETAAADFCLLSGCRLRIAENCQYGSLRISIASLKYRSGSLRSNQDFNMQGAEQPATVS